MAEFIKDKRISQSAQYDYRAASRELTELAADYKAAGDPRRARECRIYAFIAANAARAEFFDPAPQPVRRWLERETPPWSVGP